MFDSKIKKLGKNFVLGVFTVIMVVLTLLCLFNNAYISVDEHTTIVPDQPFQLIGYFIVILFVIYMMRKFIRTQESFYFNQIFVILSLLMMIVGTYFIFTHDFFPVADQNDILNAAAGLKNGDYSYFLPSGYVGKCTNQAGIVMILYGLSFIFGENNYQAFQVLNILALIGSYYSLCQISKISFHSDELKNWTLLFLVLFLPLTFYITFVYGNLFGLAFSLFAILSGYNYFETGHIKYIFLSFVSITLSMMFKSNYSITFVAMVIFVVFDIILNKRYISTILLILLVPAYFASSMIPAHMIESITGIELGKGIPMVAYIEMGLQDTPEMPGWFNGYNWGVYQNNNCDYEVANEVAINDLKNTLSYDLAHPSEFFNFLYRKTISQWCNPDFQGPWLLRHTPDYFQNETLYSFMNIVQAVICLGTLAYIYFTGRYMKLHRLLLPTVFIGGFIFHLFWEAKSQYTITYFVLLIPYCARGLMDMTNEINDSMLRIRVVKGFGNKLKLFFEMDTVRYLGLLIGIVALISLFI